MGFCFECGTESSRIRRGMCEADYRRWLRSTKQPVKSAVKPISERLDSKTDRTGECWIWTGSYDGTGYGKIWNQQIKRLVPAHRASYEVHVGPIPDGYEIDHLCRIKGCIRPDHLEAVTPEENKRRAVPFLAPWNALKTHCRKGHPYDAENTRVYLAPGATSAGRHCRACDRERCRVRRTERGRLPRATEPDERRRELAG